MKAAIVTHKVCKGDGQGRVNYEIARGMLAQGHSLTLIASEIDEELQAHPRVTWIPITVDAWPTALLKNQVFAWKSGRWLKQHHSEVDTVLVNGFITWAASDVNAAHFVHSAWLRSPAHTSRLRCDLAGLYQWLYSAVNARLERKAFAAAKTIVAVSEQIKRELVQIGVPEAKIYVIINGVDTNEFCPGHGVRNTWHLPDDVPLALFAGDIRTPRKNLDTVLHALVEVKELHLAVAGATEGSPYPALSDRLGLTSRVHFLGYRRDIADLMKTANLFVFPSRYEACSLVLLEALASGLPIVTAATAGGSEVVTPECGVVLADPNDAAALASALCRMIQDPNKLAEQGWAARKIAEQHTWATMAAAYLSILNAAQNGDAKTK